MEKRSLIPSQEQYKQTLTRLIEGGQLTCLVAVRMGCEMGMTRIEIINSRVSDLDRYHKRGLWIERAKKVRRGIKTMEDGTKKVVFEMRKRELPVNPNLYQILKSYINKDQMFILKREKGNFNNPFIPRYINHLYEANEIPWSTHKSRHFFKNMVIDWMRNNRQMDQGLIKDLLGHKKSQTERYGSISWDYKCDVIDKVFE